MQPWQVIADLEAVSGRLDKERIIREAWDAGCVEFFQGARMAYDALITYGVKKAPLIEGEDDPNFEPTLTWTKFRDVAGKLQRRELTGNMAREVLLSMSNTASVAAWNHWFRRILLKDLKCGISEVTINKVLTDIGGDALQYIIPVFSCQLAKNGDDHPAKLAGYKYLDVKLDGEMISRSFQDLMKQLNRKDDVDTSDARLALFDIIPLSDFLAGECKLPQVDRHELLVGMMPTIQAACGDRVYVIPKMMVDLDSDEGQAQFKEFNRNTVDAGYEGIMIKDPLATYKTKRTDAWMKIKPFITVDLEIVGVEPGKPESKFAHTLGGLVCRGVDQDRMVEVTVGGGYSEALRDEIWTNKEGVIGRIVEIKGDALTRAQDGDSWSLRFPVFMGFRDDKKAEA